MIKLYFTLLLLLNFFILSAQNVLIIDAETKKPISGVLITAPSSDLLTVSDAFGKVDLTEFVNESVILLRVLGFKHLTLSMRQILDGQTEISLFPSATEMPTVYVSASRWEQDEKNIVAKISLISAEDIALQNPQTTADVLANSGEVFVQKSQQGGGSPMIRGFSTNRLLYSVDGVRMNNAIFRGGNIQNVIALDPFTLESTEVFFGPGSIIYGSDAIGAVMSFKTISPTLSINEKPLISGSAVTRIASANNELTNHFHVGIGSKKWASVTSISHSKFGDLRMGSKGPNDYLKTYYVRRVDSIDQVFQNPDPLVQNPTGYKQINLMQKIRFKPNKDWDFEYGLHFSETSEFSRYDRLIETQNNGLPVFAVWNYGPQKWMMNLIQMKYQKSNRLFDHLNVRLAQQFFEESRIDRRFNQNRLRNQLEQVWAYSANTDFQKKWRKNTLQYGAEYIINKVESSASSVLISNGNELPTADRYPKSTWSSYAVYINYLREISEKVALQFGGRFNGFAIKSDFTRHLEFYPFDFTSSRINNSATTGSLGLVYHPDNTTKISISGGTAFRAPNVDDIGKIFEFGPHEIVVPNANLKAEYAYNGELNISKIIKDIVKMDGSIYYTYLNDALVRRPFQVNGQDSILFDGFQSQVFAIQNAAFATVYGFHIGFQIKLSGGFGIETRYNYQLGNEQMDNGHVSRSRHAAPGFGVTRITYHRNKLQMQLYAQYTAEVSHANLNEEERQKPFIYTQDNNGNSYSPRWYTLNFKAMFQFHPNFTVSTGVENITDQRYRPYSSGLVAPGRNFILSLKAQF